MKDAQLAIEMLHSARRNIKSAQRSEALMKHVRPYSPQYIGLARAAQRELLTARMLLQAARRVHPATTPKGKGSARPVPGEAGRAAIPVLCGCAPYPARAPVVWANDLNFGYGPDFDHVPVN